jgi:hypothetical protein
MAQKTVRVKLADSGTAFYDTYHKQQLTGKEVKELVETEYVRAAIQHGRLIKTDEKVTEKVEKPAKPEQGKEGKDTKDGKVPQKPTVTKPNKGAEGDENPKGADGGAQGGNDGGTDGGDGTGSQAAEGSEEFFTAMDNEALRTYLTNAEVEFKANTSRLDLIAKCVAHFAEASAEQ